MVIATKLYVEHPDIPLTTTIRSVPDIELGVYTDSGTDPEHDVYFYWIEAPDYDAVEEALAADPTVAAYSTIVDTERRRTYRIEYSTDAMLVAPAIADAGGLTIESRSSSNGWMMHLQLRDHGALFELNEYASRNDIHLDILELRQNDEPDDRLEFGLTSAQREALVRAYVQGYYDEPRRTSLEELASTLGISSTSVSGRLRRGSTRLIEEILMDEQA